MTRRRRPHLRVVFLSALACLGVACSGPREPLEVGVRRVPSDIVLGTQGRAEPALAVAAPVPPAPVAVNLPAPVRLPVVERFPSTPPPLPTPSPRPTCAEADPLSVPRFGATDTEGEAPVEERFTVRNEGSFTVAGANANEGTFEETSTRFVQNVVVDEDGDVTYDVVANLGGTGTQTGYLLQNTRRLDDGLGVGDQANLDQGRGLYLTEVTSRLPDDRITTFRPASPLRLLRFPAFLGDTFEASGTDPISATTMRYRVTVGERVRVDACGEYIDAIRIHLTEGRVDGPDANVEFTATYDVATQYGGLIVRDEVTLSGREGLDTVTRSNVATFTSVPTHRSEAT